MHKAHRGRFRILQSVPEEAKKAFENNVALVRQSRDILRRAAESVKASEACSRESHPAAKESSETALKD